MWPNQKISTRKFTCVEIMFHTNQLSWYFIGAYIIKTTYTVLESENKQELNIAHDKNHSLQKGDDLKFSSTVLVKK